MLQQWNWPSNLYKNNKTETMHSDAATMELT
jgi:hypothetical protein